MADLPKKKKKKGNFKHQEERGKKKQYQKLVEKYDTMHQGAEIVKQQAENLR